MRPTQSALTCIAMTLFACESSSSNPLPDASIEADAGISMHTSDGGTENHSFESATLLADGVPRGDTISTNSEVDFFRFEGSAGTYVAISTSGGGIDLLGEFDPKLTLWNSDRVSIAQNDDVLPLRTGGDSQILTRLPSTGTFYVTVAHAGYSAGDPQNQPFEDGPGHYDVFIAVGELSSTENGNELANALPISDLEQGAILYSEIDASDDQDVYSLRIAESSAQLEVHLLPAGATGNGSTIQPEIRVTDAAGEHVFAQSNPGFLSVNETIELRPSLPAGSYLLWARSNGSSLGTNPFYVVKARVQAETQIAAEPNDSAESASRLVPADRPDGYLAKVVTTLEPGDRDHFAFDLPAGLHVVIGCDAAAIGSSVDQLNMALFSSDAPDRALDMSVETAEGRSALFLGEVTAGSYLLALTRGTVPLHAGDPFVRCEVFGY